MKGLQNIKNIGFIAALLLLTACTKNNMAETMQHGDSDMGKQAARTAEITFKKGKLIEVAYLSITAD